MTRNSFRIATQNIQWGGDPAPGGDGQPRLTRLLPFMLDLDADLLVLTEYKSGVRGDELQALLKDAGYAHFFHQSPPTSFSLGTAIASRDQVVPAQPPLAPTVAPWRCTAVNANGINIFGFYFPLKGMPDYWDWVLANAKELMSRDAILIGDFNTGKHFIDEEADVFSCSDKHIALEELGFVDTWRASNATDRGATWYSSANRGFRLDYIWASPSIAEKITAIHHNDDARNAGATDHSAVVAEIRLDLHKTGGKCMAPSDPIASTEQYKRALLSLRDNKKLPDGHLTMLRAQGRSANGTITSTKLAEAAGYENYNAANLQYGTLACNLACYLDYTPPKRKDGSPMCWTTLSYSVDGQVEPETGQFQFIMRPELLAALREMKWVRPELF